MKQILRSEELLQLIVCIYAFTLLPVHISWWAWPFLFLSPDLSIFGYAINTKVGAAIYNIFHHKGIAAFIFMIGIYIQNPITELIGIILFAHSSFDRFLGYGLKYSDSFSHTHL